MVFLKPTILIDSESSQDISTEKYNYIKAQRLINDSSREIIDLSNPDN